MDNTSIRDGRASRLPFCNVLSNDRWQNTANLPWSVLKSGSQIIWYFHVNCAALCYLAVFNIGFSTVKLLACMTYWNYCYLGSAFLCKWALRYQRILCFGINSDRHIASSCHPWTNTELFGLSLESDRSTKELVGDVGLASQVNHEWLPHRRRFWKKY